MNGVCPVDNEAIDRMNAEDHSETTYYNLSKILSEMTPEEQEATLGHIVKSVLSIQEKAQKVSGCVGERCLLTDEELDLYYASIKIRMKHKGTNISPSRLAQYVNAGAMNSGERPGEVTIVTGTTDTTKGSLFNISHTTLEEALKNDPEEIWIVIDSAYVSVTAAECETYKLQEEIAACYPNVAKVSMHSGQASAEFIAKAQVVLMPTTCGFYVEKARGTDAASKYIPYK